MPTKVDPKSKINSKYTKTEYKAPLADKAHAKRAPKALASVAAVRAAKAKKVADSGILAALANFTPGAPNQVSAQAGFVARAVVMPPGTIAGVLPITQFSVVAYVTQLLSPVTLNIPNVEGILVVDLPDGMLPPEGGGTIYDAINAAIMSQLSPPPPGGTGNDDPPGHP